MEFRQIQYFLCLCEEGSVTRAADRLHIVQPALSMQIRRLEEELGHRLFVRGRRGMTPTPAGSQMYRTFRPIVADFAQARERFVRAEGELRGHVRIGLIASIAQEVLVDSLLEFSAQHPQVTLSFTDGFTDTLCRAVSDGDLDAALINKPRRRHGLASETLLTEDIALVTGPDHPRLPDEVPFREALKLSLVLPTQAHGLRGVLDSFASAEGHDLVCALEVDSIPAIVRIVERSHFATLLPRIAVRHRIDTGLLRPHRVIRPNLARQIACVSHPRRPLGAAASAFVGVLGKHLRSG